MDEKLREGCAKLVTEWQYGAMTDERFEQIQDRLDIGYASIGIDKCEHDLVSAVGEIHRLRRCAAQLEALLKENRPEATEPAHPAGWLGIGSNG